jgi:hypothetical protein
MSDGSESAWPVILTASIQQLADMGWMTTSFADRLCQQIGEAFPSSIYNDTGRLIGRREAVFQLHFAK